MLPHLSAGLVKTHAIGAGRAAEEFGGLGGVEAALHRQAERLAAIGQLGIAMRHEINNPLTTVIGNAELLMDRYGQGREDLQRRLQMILDNALRIAEILKRLQDMKKDRTVEYVEGLRMTDLGPSGNEP